MARKKQAPVKGNHITSKTRTLVARIPLSVHAAYEQEAKALEQPVAALVKEALARDLARRGYKILPETREACGL